jgi:hypothetical protein
VDRLSRLPAPSEHKSSYRKARDKKGDSSSPSNKSSQDSTSKSDSKSDSDLERQKSDKKKKSSWGKKKKDNCRKPRHDDSDSSSSYPTLSSSEESDSNSDRNKGIWWGSNHYHSAKPKKEHHSRKGKSKGGNWNKYSDPNPSMGDKEYIYKLAIDGRVIDGEVGPLDLWTKDSKEHFKAAADVTSLTGMLRSSTSMDKTSEDARNTTEMVATLVATAMAGHTGFMILCGKQRNGMPFVKWNTRWPSSVL